MPSTQRELHARSLADPEGFWGEAARAIDWNVPPRTVLDRSRTPFDRWFPDGELNACPNALDRPVDAGRGGAAALTYSSPVTGPLSRHTWAELPPQAARLAGALQQHGFPP